MIKLQRFEKTTEMLNNCNALSAGRLQAAGAEFKRHTQLLLHMKRDLEYVFKKIRAIKTKLSTQYPEAYKVAVAASFASRKPVDDEDAEEPPVERKPPRMVPTVSTETLKPSSAPERRRGGAARSGGAGGRKSSSSDTESAASSGDSSTDTG